MSYFKTLHFHSAVELIQAQEDYNA